MCIAHFVDDVGYSLDDIVFYRRRHVGIVFERDRFETRVEKRATTERRVFREIPNPVFLVVHAARQFADHVQNSRAEMRF